MAEALWRLSAPLTTLAACGIARLVEDDVIELVVSDEEATTGGMATISMKVRLRGGAEEWYSAWLSIPAGVADGVMLRPSVLMDGMERAPRFRVRRVA